MPWGDLRRRLRPALTVLGVLAVILAELALLTAVYHRPAAVRRQSVTQAQLAGELSDASPQAALVRTVQNALITLHDQGTSDTDLARLRQTARSMATDPTEPASLRQVIDADNALGATLRNRQHSIDNEAEAIYIVLLALASIGWFGWFRRVVRRQRALQRTLTEQTAQAVGEAKLAALVRNAGDVIAVIDLDSTISYISPSAVMVLAATPDQLVGTRLADLIHSDDVELFTHLLGAITAGTEAPINLRVRRRDGRDIYVEGQVHNSVGDPTIDGLIVTLRDVTDRRALEQRLNHAALHDSLTGLANRRLFADRLGHALERRGERMEPQAVLFIDLDDFKTVNDSLGHEVGDSVLAEMGHRFDGLLRAGDTVARVGGDQFAVLMEGATLEEAREATERLLDVISAPMLLDGVTVQINASIGITQAVPGEVNAEEALRNADLAMYWAKENGKSTAAVYESRLHAAALDRLQLRADLQRALRRDELVLYYQPEVDLTTGAVIGVEALVRWNHPTRGMLPPAMFVPMAEETGLILPLDRWVIATACRAAAELQAESRGLTMSINLSAQYLDHPDLVDMVASVVSDNALNPQHLVLEITESAILRDLDVSAPRLAALRKTGVRIAIDDFGTGYNSLAYLSQLEIDILKIDKSFIDRVTVDRQDAAITEAIIAMGSKLGLQTIAEGVEYDAQADWLRDAGCNVGQGYVWSRPVDRKTLRRCLTQGFPTHKSVPHSATPASTHTA
jgi:diguanylate cyclase (GGDEF)-like protein/PAS domain S-box-containing protein